MSDSEQPTRPANDADPNTLPTFEEIVSDPEIAALLDFEPVPRARIVKGSWTPELQREFVARLAVHGAIQLACDEMGKNRTGYTRLTKHKLAASFRDACDRAIELARERLAEVDAMIAQMDPEAGPAPRPAPIDYRRKRPLDPRPGTRLPDQILNEYGEYEDEASYAQRVEEARDSISDKLKRARRLFLMSISNCPGKRAAFEILTELPVDWEKAERLEPQEFEPWQKVRMREPDMLLTAEAGWMGDVAHGPDKKRELQEAVNAWRVENGQEPIDWSVE